MAADYTPDDPTELTEQLCPLHSAQVFVNGDLVPAPEKEVFIPAPQATGPLLDRWACDGRTIDASTAAARRPRLSMDRGQLSRANCVDA